MENPPQKDIIDNQTEDELDDEIMAQLDGALDHPQYSTKDNIFKFFKHILKLKDSTKVSNLREEEIGKSRLSMRSYLELAAYAEAESLDTVSQYFKDKAEILASTSMGRKGFFLQTSVTQIRKDHKVAVPTQQPKKMWGGQNQQQGDTNV